MAQHVEVRPTSPRPLPRRALPQRTAGQPRGGRARWSLALGIAIAGVAGLTLALRSFPQDRPRQVMPQAAVPAGTSSFEPAWKAVQETTPVLAWAGGDPAPKVTDYRVRQAIGTGAREDRITFGRFDEGPHLSLTLTRSEPSPALPYFVEVARRAAQAGLWVVRLGRPEPMPARFETLEAADTQLSNGPITRTCLSFRVRQPELGLALAGWNCPEDPAVDARQQLACALDRLSLTEATSDLALRVAFAEAPPRKDPACSSSGAEPALQAAQAPVVSPRHRLRRSAIRRPHVSRRTSLDTSL